MAASGITRNKLFEISASAHSPAAMYFEAVNTLVAEMRFDYPDACRMIGTQAKSDNMRSFLLRLSDALRSGEPIGDFLTREAGVLGEDYQSRYDRDLESMKQWTNAFSSIVISVALIVIIQMISSMIYSLNTTMMTGLISTGVIMAGFGSWIIYRSAPKEKMVVSAKIGSPDQQRAMKLFRVIVPAAVALGVIAYLINLPMGMILIGLGVAFTPIGLASFVSDRTTVKKDSEFSTFLRSSGGMATASGTTIKQALTRIDLTSFPTLEPDIRRLSARLGAGVDPEVCWTKFGHETGSALISEVVGIFYGAIRTGGDPERVGFVCSLFTSRTTQLRAKRRLTAGTFMGLTSVMQAVVAGIMVFVLSIINSFALMMDTLMPDNPDAMRGQQMQFAMAQFNPGDLAFLQLITIVMVILLALVGAFAIIAADGGFRLKVCFFLAVTMFISGISFVLVPPLVAGILKM